jgi:hypothetical protein
MEARIVKVVLRAAQALLVETLDNYLHLQLQEDK